jgi:hypothetical protein
MGVTSRSSIKGLLNFDAGFLEQTQQCFIGLFSGFPFLFYLVFKFALNFCDHFGYFLGGRLPHFLVGFELGIEPIEFFFDGLGELADAVLSFLFLEGEVLLHVNDFLVDSLGHGLDVLTFLVGDVLHGVADIE